MLLASNIRLVVFLLLLGLKKEEFYTVLLSRTVLCYEFFLFPTYRFSSGPSLEQLKNSSSGLITDQQRPPL